MGNIQSIEGETQIEQRPIRGYKSNNGNTSQADIVESRIIPNRSIHGQENLVDRSFQNYQKGSSASNILPQSHQLNQSLSNSKTSNFSSLSGSKMRHRQTQRDLDYQVVKQSRDERYGEVKILQSKSTGEMVAIRTSNFIDQTEFENYERLCQLYKNTNYPQLVRVIDYILKKDEALCSNNYTITATFEYLEHDLLKEMKNRIEEGRRFDQVEIFTLIQTLTEALGIIIKNGLIVGLDASTSPIVHGDFQPQMVLYNGQQGAFKITDTRFLSNKGSAYQDTLFGLRGPESCYMAQELFEQLKNEELYPEYDPIKGDIFSIGLIALHTALVGSQENITQLYNFSTFDFNRQELLRLLNRASENYSPRLVSLIKSMVDLNVNERIGIDAILLQCATFRGALTKSILRKPLSNNTDFSNNSNVNGSLHKKNPPAAIPEKGDDEETSPIKKLDTNHLQSSKRNSGKENQYQPVNGSDQQKDSFQSDEKNQKEPKNLNLSVEQSLLEIDRKVQDALSMSKEMIRRYEQSPLSQFKEQFIAEENTPINSSIDYQENNQSLSRNQSSFNGSQILPAQNSKNNYYWKNNNHNASQSNANKKDWVQY